jgi:hypothetical protein
VNILLLYNATQTYTNTVFEHLVSLARESKHRTFFCHIDQYSEFAADLSRFDAVGLHYTVRLPFDQVSSSLEIAFAEFSGLKFLFIQDEYDHTHRAWHWIKKLGLNLVFTVVPEAGIERIYPSKEFPGVRFVSNLTGYVPEGLDRGSNVPPPSKRPLMIGYRGRPLPIRYGMLGVEKVSVGEITKKYCEAHGVVTDIAWSEESRIYGPRWYEFMVSCRSMLGSESGSNVFDWDGSLAQNVAEFKQRNPGASEPEVYESVVRSKEIDGIMNQVSPRVFEAIAARTVLVLFEGNYSGVVKPGEHFIPLKKDGSNLAEVVSLLHDGAYVDAMAERAYHDVIASGKYSYKTFVQMVDGEIERSLSDCRSVGIGVCSTSGGKRVSNNPSPITTSPIRALAPRWRSRLERFAIFWWALLPDALRRQLGPTLKSLLKRGKN